MKKSYHKKYKKKIEEEEEEQQKVAQEETNVRKKHERDQFLSEFFIPLRKDFEKNIKEYEKLFPIAQDNLVEIEQEVIYSFAKEISEKKINE